MNSSSTLTHAALIKPIPYTLNLSNVAAAPASKVCALCTLIVPDRSKAHNNLIKIEYSRIDQYPDFPDLKRGCSLCKFLRKTIRRGWAVRPMEEWGIGAIKEGEETWHGLLNEPWDGKVKIFGVQFAMAKNETDSDATVISLSLEIGPATPLLNDDGTERYGDISQIIGFQVFDSKDLYDSTKEFGRRLPAVSTLSSENLNLISRWISECKLHHPKCQRDEFLWVPSRLLEIEFSGKTDSLLIKLIQTNSVDLNAPYTALSHMWGDNIKPPLRTLSSNYDSMVAGIGISLLPKNFADAIRVTNQLGLRYIWIDSLCIIQDNTDDWRVEAATMHMVYSNAEFTIVATSATSSHDGFLERNLSLFAANKVSYNSNNHKEQNDFIILCPNDDEEAGNWSGDVDSSPWNGRGWTMQERSLSTRIIHFCKKKLYFECRTCQRSEEGEPFSNLRFYELWPRNEEWMKLPVSSLELQKFYKRWSLTVTEYTKRRLTKEFDKLPAIESVGKEMELKIKDKYLNFAGMWRNNLKHDLLWQVQDGPPAKLPDYYRAPSWSWASIETKLIWKEGYVKSQPEHALLPDILFEVLEIIEKELSIYAAPNYLKVRSWAVNISLLEECDNEERWVFGRSLPHDLYTLKPNNYSTDSDLDPSLDPQNPLKDIQSNLKFAEGRLDLDDRDIHSQFSRNFCHFHVDSTCSPSGLILEKLRDDPIICKRIGVATVFDYSKGSQLFTEEGKDGKPFSKNIFRSLNVVEILLV